MYHLTGATATVVPLRFELKAGSICRNAEPVRDLPDHSLQAGKYQNPVVLVSPREAKATGDAGESKVFFFKVLPN